jgi:hypothetical protein
MNQATGSVVDRYDRDAQAAEALDKARGMPQGPERNAALKQASLLRVAADATGLVFPTRGRPRK